MIFLGHRPFLSCTLRICPAFCTISSLTNMILIFRAKYVLSLFVYAGSLLYQSLAFPPHYIIQSQTYIYRVCNVENTVPLHALFNHESRNACLLKTQRVKFSHYNESKESKIKIMFNCLLRRDLNAKQVQNLLLLFIPSYTG